MHGEEDLKLHFVKLPRVTVSPTTDFRKGIWLPVVHYIVIWTWKIHVKLGPIRLLDRGFRQNLYYLQQSIHLVGLMGVPAWDTCVQTSGMLALRLMHRHQSKIQWCELEKYVCYGVLFDWCSFELFKAWSTIYCNSSIGWPEEFYPEILLFKHEKSQSFSWFIAINPTQIAPLFHPRKRILCVQPTQGHLISRSKASKMPLSSSLVFKCILI